ncbi:ImmA/IrrE family metallo-endopeptidase [Bacteroides fragilis]
MSPVSHLYFRRKLSLSAKTIDSFVAKSRIIKFALDDLFNAVDLPVYDIGTYDPNEFSPQDIADKIRYKLKVFRGPVPNLTALLENHGIVIWKMDFETDKIDGLSTVTNSGQNIIFLNSQMPNDRIRFSLAHELGHMIMHMETPPPSVEVAEEQADALRHNF